MLADLLHVGISRRDSAAANPKGRRKPFDKSFVLDDLSHPRLQSDLALRLSLRILVE